MMMRTRASAKSKDRFNALEPADLASGDRAVVPLELAAPTHEASDLLG